MTREEEQLKVFETRVRQLILQYKDLERENDELRMIISQKEESISQLHSNVAQLDREYQNLKLAKMIEISDEDMKNARQRLSKLIRDVNKCIALLSV